MTARHNDTKTVIEATFGGGLVLSEQPITAAEGMDILQQTGVLKQGHFLLTSGLHSDQYLQCALLLQYPWHAEKVCQAMAAPFSGQPIDVVVGPAIGGIVVAYETARVLGVRYMHAERENGVMTFRRGERSDSSRTGGRQRTGGRGRHCRPQRPESRLRRALSSVSSLGCGDVRTA